MNILRYSRHFLALTVLLVLVADTSSTAHAASCDVIVRLDAVMVSSNIAKVGFPPLLANNQNPTIYFRKKQDLGESFSISCYVCHESGARNISDTWMYDGLTGNPPVLTNWSGFLFYHSETNGTVAYDCDSTRTGPAAWSNPSCGFGSVPATDVVVSNRTMSSYQLVKHSETYELVTTSSGTAIHEATADSDLQINLTQPYALSDFVAASLAALNAAPFPSWANATRTGWSERGGRNVITQVNEDRAEFNAALTKLKYRIAVRGPKGEKQKITWIERFTPNGGGPVQDTQYSEDFTFTGGEQYTSYTEQSGVYLAPPAQAGRIEVLLLSDWACDGPGCGPGKGRVSTGSIDVRMGLGKTTTGESAGYLYIKEETPRGDIATSQRLAYYVDPSVQVVKDGAMLRQINAPQTLAQVVPITSGYEVRFFGPATNQDVNGYFIPTGQPLYTWRIESPGNNTNHLRVTQIGAGDPLESNFEWSVPDQAWALVVGNYRKEIRTSIIEGAYRTETFTVREMNDQITYRQVRVWLDQISGLGEQLQSETIGEGADALTTTWYYYFEPIAPAIHGKLQYLIRPNGLLEEYFYEDPAGRLTHVYAGNRATIYSYAPVDPADNGTRDPDTPRRVIDSVNNEETSRLYRSFRSDLSLEIQCTVAGAAWNDPSNLFTTNRTATGPGGAVVTRSSLPDGTLRIVSTPGDQPGVPRTASDESGKPNAAGDAVADGIRNITEFDGAGRIKLRQTKDIATGTMLSSETYEYDGAFGPATKVTYADGTSTTSIHQNCCAASMTVERDGTITAYSYDTLDRLAATTRHSITLSNSFDAMGNVIRVTRIGTDGSQMVVSQAAFDTVGRQISSSIGQASPTTIVYEDSGDTTITWTPDGGFTAEHHALDGSLVSISGTATAPRFYQYGFEPAGGGPLRRYTKETRGSPTGADWTKTYFDLAGRVVRTELSDGSYAQSFYNAKGQIWKERGYDGRITLLAYNARGEVEFAAQDVNGNDVIDLAGPDRVVQTISDFSAGQQRTRTFVYPTTGSTNSLLVSTRQSSADGAQFTETRLSGTASVQTEYLGGGIRRITQVGADGVNSVSVLRGDQVISTSRKGSGGEDLGAVRHSYDAHGRLHTTTDLRTGAVTTHLANTEDRISSVTTASAPGIPSQTTAFFYDASGRMKRAVLPDTLTLSNQFNALGQLTKSFGARTYPVDYGYDTEGRLTNMLAGGAATRWEYQPQRGWLANKYYADNAGPGYSYTADGRVQTRTTPRVATTYGYTPAGDLSTITYSTLGETVSFLDLDRQGRPGRVTVGANSTSLLGYHPSGVVSGESLDNLVVTNILDSALRRQSVVLKRADGTTLLTHSFAYDGASRITSVSAGSVNVSYTHVPRSPLIQSVAFNGAGGLALATVRSYDHLNRLTEIGSMPGAPAAGAFLFRYGHNLANQRTNATETDGSRWHYLYDAMGQLVSGKKYFADGTPVAGQQFEYTFDAIGNRTASKAGGDAAGGSLRSASYTPTTLNQYTSRTVPGAVDIVGQAPEPASVTVNGQGTYRKGDYWQLAFATNNSSAAVWMPLTNTAVLVNLRQTNLGAVFLPRTPESFVHDADGNLTQDGRWDLTWDAENRLTHFISRSDTTTNSWVSGKFGYDWRGRRVSKTVSNWNGVAWVKWSETRFAWDGWRIIAELDATQNSANPSLLRSYVWGADLSGTLDGAGGVGGLLAMIDHVAIKTYFYAHDGNGNVRALVNAADGTIAAQYDYGPFGELIRATGPMAKVNPFRFSTKYQDDETEFVDYGSRLYRPNSGCWASRDSIEEVGGENLYGFVFNNPISFIDRSGFDVMAPLPESPAIAPGRPPMLSPVRSPAPAPRVPTPSPRVSGTAVLPVAASPDDYEVPNPRPTWQNKNVEALTQGGEASQSACRRLAMSRPGQNQYFYSPSSTGRATGAAAVIWNKQNGGLPVDPPGFNAAKTHTPGSVDRGHLIPYAYGGSGGKENVVTQERGFNRGVFRVGTVDKIKAAIEKPGQCTYVCMVVIPFYRGVGATGVRDPGRPIPFSFQVMTITGYSYTSELFNQPQLMGDWKDDIPKWNTWATGVIPLN